MSVIIRDSEWADTQPMHTVPVHERTVEPITQRFVGEDWIARGVAGVAAVAVILFSVAMWIRG